MIAVKWFDRFFEDALNLTFRKWINPSENPPPHAVVNSTELREIDVALIRKMPVVLYVVRPPPLIRQSRRLAAVVEHSPDVLEMPDDSEFELLPDRDARI